VNEHTGKPYADTTDWACEVCMARGQSMAVAAYSYRDSQCRAGHPAPWLASPVAMRVYAAQQAVGASRDFNPHLDATNAVLAIRRQDDIAALMSTGCPECGKVLTEAEANFYLDDYHGCVGDGTHLTENPNPVEEEDLGIEAPEVPMNADHALRVAEEELTIALGLIYDSSEWVHGGEAEDVQAINSLRYARDGLQRLRETLTELDMIAIELPASTIEPKLRYRED
jgi:hypothetical protein